MNMMHTNTAHTNLTRTNMTHTNITHTTTLSRKEQEDIRRISALCRLTDGLFYPYAKRSYNRETGEVTTTDGYRILPEGWEKSYYWSFEILNDYVRYFVNEFPPRARVKGGRGFERVVCKAPGRVYPELRRR